MHLLRWEVFDEDGMIRLYLEKDVATADYAILSHRWGKSEDEVSFEDMVAGTPESKKGYAKLVGCCKQAQKEGIRYVWADTCCINKASSAELSEAITSMFGYYERAKVCYVFLDDVTSEPGWTLQELIAPQHVKFFDSRWSFLGHKTDQSLLPIIVTTTNIDPIVLSDPITTKVISVSKRMSWASRRQTTRQEDMAYSLMGIFGVFMAPLYGEGAHAFIRLQEAIMKTSNDHTIFAWTSSPPATLSHGLESVSTMLALSPSQFEKSGDFQPLPYSKNTDDLLEKWKLDYATTNSGLLIRLPLLTIDETNGLYAAFLGCTEGTNTVPSAILLKTSPGTPYGHFWRTNCNLGPTERIFNLWFNSSGRGELRKRNIYILPRLTQISPDNIEPPWDGADILRNSRDFKKHLLTGRGDSGSIDMRFESGSCHVPDPSHEQLVLLCQARELVFSNQPDVFTKIMESRRLILKTTMPTRNGYHIGRAHILEQLIDQLTTPVARIERCSDVPRTCWLCGIGGIGKTQMAIEFTYHCWDHRLFDSVLWIPATSHDTIVDAFKTFALKLNLIDPDDMC